MNQLTLKCTTRQGPFSLFQNLELSIALTDDKCHLATSWTRSCQYQCVCKSLSKYSKRFKSYGHFSLTVRGQNLHKLTGDKQLHKLSQGDYKAHSESQPSAFFVGRLSMGRAKTEQNETWRRCFNIRDVPLKTLHDLKISKCSIL